MNLCNWLSYSKGRQRYPVDSTILVSPILMCWIVICLLDNAIQHVNNWGQDGRGEKVALNLV